MGECERVNHQLVFECRDRRRTPAFGPRNGAALRRRADRGDACRLRPAAAGHDGGQPPSGAAAGAKGIRQAPPHSAGGEVAAREVPDGNGSTYGVASFYSYDPHTASGEKFNAQELTAAHRTLPFGTRLRVTDVATGRSVTVRVNDRGPFVRGRVVDVSRGAAQTLGITGKGVAKVKIDVVEHADASK